MKGVILRDTLSESKQSAWQLLMSVITHFLENKQIAECEKEIDKLLKKNL